jgi:hypothetical protein
LPRRFGTVPGANLTAYWIVRQTDRAWCFSTTPILSVPYEGMANSNCPRNTKIPCRKSLFFDLQSFNALFIVFCPNAKATVVESLQIRTKFCPLHRDRSRAAKSPSPPEDDRAEEGLCKTSISYFSSSILIELIYSSFISTLMFTLLSSEMKPSTTGE